MELGRRWMLASAAVLAAPAQAQEPEDRLRTAWLHFRDRFVNSEGRVIDTGNGQISHSEGQGWAMLAAVRADDRPSFEQLLGWTLRTLRRDSDRLAAWRFRPNATPAVDDPNNATDGDMFIAWALTEAGTAWGVPDHTARGLAIARDILRLLVREAGPYTVLLPGARHFETPRQTVVNLSYYAFPALRALAAALPDPAWLRIAADGVALLRLGRFGRWRLPPDWLAITRTDGKLSLPGNWPPRFSYDAIRVPLYMAWVGLEAEPAVQAAAGFWADPLHRHLPAWTDLNSNAISPYPANAGLAAVARLVGARQGRAGPHGLNARFPPSDYYASALVLLVTLAERDLAATAATLGNAQ
jgi:endoglucanase